MAKFFVYGQELFLASSDLFISAIYCQVTSREIHSQEVWRDQLAHNILLVNMTVSSVQQQSRQQLGNIAM